ncbi:MAG: sulfatase, partial [Verrucomicrobiae bacterium]|nr:sulfatase [Verrucomicrobiae bacterium]
MVLVAEETHPDILMIAIDDLRPMLGCYGDARAITPNIDRLAGRSVLFERAYCQYAKCGPSRLSIMTGLRPDSVNVFNHRDQDVEAFRKSRPDATSMARWFKDHGYHTQGFGKIYHDGWDVAEDWSSPSMPGRDREMLEIVDQANLHGPTIIADRHECPVMQSPDVEDDHLFAGRMTNAVLEVMQADLKGKPKLLAVGYRRPHLPFVAPKKYYELHDPDESWLAPNPEPAVGSPVMAWFNSDGYGSAMKREGITLSEQPSREEAISLNGYEMRSYQGVIPQGPIPAHDQLELLQAYAACVSYVDTQIGRLLDALESSGKLNDTLIILWTDHGWHLGEQSAWSKMTTFEVATRVPFLISGPGIQPGRTQTLAELVDLYPTLCDLSGLPAPNHLEGESLAEALAEPSITLPSVALSQHVRFKER